MSASTPRLRGNSPRSSGPWPVGDVPARVLIGIGKQLVHRLAIGHADIAGDDFGTIFANAIDGEHRESPLGIADVIANGTAWSVKTVKATRPHNQPRVRLISGRNSPDYSSGIADPRRDSEATGRAVLSIWNARLNESLNHHDELRIAVLLRNMEAREFALFECPAVQFPTGDYHWSFNSRGNLEGRDKATGWHCFTWQPHGSQFTIIRPVPGSVRRFSIDRNVPLVAPEHVLRVIRFAPDWISFG